MSNSTPSASPGGQDWAAARDNAKDAAASAGKMASHVASAISSMASRAAGDAGKKADDLTASAGVGIQGLGDKLSQNTAHEGLLASASQAVARSVQDGCKYVETSRFSGMTGDVIHLIRRNPVPAVLLSIGLGWFASRLLKR